MIKLKRLPLSFPPFKHAKYEFDVLEGWYTLIKAKGPKQPFKMLPEQVKGVQSEVYMSEYGTSRVIIGKQYTESEGGFIAPVTEAMHPRWYIGNVGAQTEDGRKWSYTVLFYQHDLTGRLHVFFFTEPNIKTDKQRARWANDIIPALRLSFNAREVEL
jgi:hypothetical protein